jgi:hypothetical protein
MLTDRIIKALTFQTEVYSEVERDTTFTFTAWTMVTLITFVNQLVEKASGNIFRWLAGSIVGTVFLVFGFALAVAVINWIGREVFNADVTFNELVRTMGLAFVWNAVMIVAGIIGHIPFLACLLWPAIILAVLLTLAAWAVALHEALDLEWIQTIVTAILGLLFWGVIYGITAAVLNIFKLGTLATIRALRF